MAEKLRSASKCPAPLDSDRCTMKQAAAAHKKSAKQCLACSPTLYPRDRAALRNSHAEDGHEHGLPEEHVCLHVCAPGSPSGSDPDAGARTRLSFTRSRCLWHLAMGKLWKKHGFAMQPR